MSIPVADMKDRLYEALRDKGISQQDLSNATKIPKASISQYINGFVNPKQDRLYKMAHALDVDPVWLLGFNVPKKNCKNIRPIEKRRIPVLGEIACGKPIYINEDRESYVEIGTDVPVDFCLIAHGDSMTGARINNGDVVFIHQQPQVENGEIAAVAIDDEATLKRVYYYEGENMITLVAENPAYPPLVYTGEQLDDIYILGKAIAFQSDVI